MFKFILVKFTHEIGFRLLSIIFYPIAYSLRWNIRERLYSKYNEFFNEISFSDTRAVAKPKFSLVDRLYLFLWFFLDDSPAKDSFVVINKHTYNESHTWDSAENKKAYPFSFLFESRALRDWYWSNIRNSHVNYFSYILTGGWKTREVIKGSFSENIGNSWALFKTAFTKTVQDKWIKTEFTNTPQDKWIKQVEYGFYIVKVTHINGEVSPFLMYHSKRLYIAIGKDSGSGREVFVIRKSMRAEDY